MDIVARYQDTSSRRVLDLRPAGLAEVPVLGRYSYTEARPDVPVHRHFGCLEVHYCASGQQVFEVGSQRYTLRGGQLFVTFPDEPHSTGGEPSEPGTTYWFVLRMPRPRQRMLGLLVRESASLVARLRSLPRRHFPTPMRTKRLFDQLLHLYDRPDTLLRAECARPWSACCWKSLRGQCEIPSGRSPLAWHPSLSDSGRAEEEYSLNGLARDAHLSLPRFKSRFKVETGMSPWQFILHCKIEAAQSRLRGGNEPITKIALDLGFSSPPYFATVFKRVTGFTPRTYRAELPPRDATTRRDDGQG